MERLQKVIASRGLTSRRKAEELIKNGLVYVNGQKVTELGTKVNLDADIIVDGKHLESKPKEYYLLNKPRGVICSLKDEKNRKIITDLIATEARIYPVGRLDYDTTGLIILTNDGNLTNKLTHPSYEVEKTYIAKLNKIFTVDDLYKLKEGIKVDGRMVRPKRLKIKATDKQKNTSIVEITIIEGRNHIVKNIFKTLGYEVTKLSRISYDFLTLGHLKSGEYRPLTLKEVKKLLKKSS